MLTLDKRNFARLGQKAIAPFCAVVVIGYFIYHSIQGERGLLSWMRLQDRLHTQEDLLNQLIKKRKALEIKTSCLRPESLDRDLLDLQVRLTLGYTHPQEVVILTLDLPNKGTPPKAP